MYTNHCAIVVQIIKLYTSSICIEQPLKGNNVVIPVLLCTVLYIPMEIAGTLDICNILAKCQRTPCVEQLKRLR